MHQSGRGPVVKSQETGAGAGRQRDNNRKSRTSTQIAILNGPAVDSDPRAFIAGGHDVDKAHWLRRYNTDRVAFSHSRRRIRSAILNGFQAAGGNVGDACVWRSYPPR